MVNPFPMYKVSQMNNNVLPGMKIEEKKTILRENHRHMSC